MLRNVRLDRAERWYQAEMLRWHVVYVRHSFFAKFAKVSSGEGGPRA